MFAGSFAVRAVFGHACKSEGFRAYNNHFFLAAIRVKSARFSRSVGNIIALIADGETPALLPRRANISPIAACAASGDKQGFYAAKSLCLMPH